VAAVLLAGTAAAALLGACKTTGQRAPSTEQRGTETGDAGGAPGDSSHGGSPTAKRARDDRPPTYWNRVANILQTSCTSCHARGGIGPMPLTSYADARDHAARIVQETRERRMPPWLPDTSSCAPLEHSRALPPEDIDALAAWLASGTPEGDPADQHAAPAKQTFAKVTGEPDRVATPELAYSPKRGRADDYHCFVLDPKLDEKERVTALRIQPGAGAIVHHVLLYEVRKSALDRIHELDEKEAGPGYTCFGGIGVTPRVSAGKPGSGDLVDFDAQMVVAWAPGAGATDVAGAPTALPEGTAIHLAPGSRLVMQVHYSLENLQPAMTDKTRIDMWFAKDEPRRQAVWVPLFKYDFRVPAGIGPDDPRATARAEINMPFPLTVLGVAPHMHLRGRSAHIEALDDADPAKCLLDVPRWDFHHQEAYWLAKGVRIGRAALTCKWDNRTESQPLTNGRRRATKDLRWGEGTDDEMCLAFLYTTL
jgi:mono/diheme cytochrome c family protein